MDMWVRVCSASIPVSGSGRFGWRRANDGTLIVTCSITSGRLSRPAAACSTLTTERLAQWSTQLAKRGILSSRTANSCSTTSKTWVKQISYSRLWNISTARTNPCRSELDERTLATGSCHTLEPGSRTTVTCESSGWRAPLEQADASRSDAHRCVDRGARVAGPSGRDGEFVRRLAPATGRGGASAHRLRLLRGSSPRRNRNSAAHPCLGRSGHLLRRADQLPEPVDAWQYRETVALQQGLYLRRFRLGVRYH